VPKPPIVQEISIIDQSLRIRVPQHRELGAGRKPETKGEKGGARAGSGRKAKNGRATDYNQGDNVTLKNEMTQRGNSAEHRTEVLLRDHPEIAARMALGEFKSVADADEITLDVASLSVSMPPTWCNGNT
jgi:hypothetical protein